MWLNKLKSINLDKNLGNYFILPFGCLAFLITIGINLLGLHLDWIIDQKSLTVIGLILGFAAFLTYYSNLSKESLIQKKLPSYIPAILILSLVSLNLQVWGLISITRNINAVLVTLSLTSILFLFFTKHRQLSKEQISTPSLQINQGKGRFPRARIMTWISWIVVIAILALFTWIKVPYLGVSFSGEHRMKYNALVEPAAHMVEHDSIFWNQKIYLSEPDTNPRGIFSTFGNLPLMEWGLFTIYKVFPHNSIETNTRIFTNLIGIIALLFAYIFFSKRLGKTNSLIVLFFLAINPIISFLTFVTVEDSLLMLFMFISLFYLEKWLESSGKHNLFLAGLYFGIGNACKYSLFLWYAPLAGVLILSRKKGVKDSWANYLFFIGLSILPILMMRTSVRYLPSHPLTGLALTVVWAVVFSLIYKFQNKIMEVAQTIMAAAMKSISVLVTTVIVALIGISIFLSTIDLAHFAGEFFTDPQLIFNLKMYKYMISEQFAKYITPSVFYMGVIGIILTLITKKSEWRNTVGAFLLGALLYWIIASKVIFFHNYYTGIIMITLSLGAAMLTIIIAKLLNNKYSAIAVILLLGLLVYPSSYQANIKRLQIENKDLGAATDYLISNTSEEDAYIDGSSVLTLTLLTNRSRIEPSILIGDPIIQDTIASLGFADAMKKYHIKYFITTNTKPDFSEWKPLFSSERTRPIQINRTELILSQIDEEESLSQTNSNEVISNKFILEKEVGSYKFFRFQN